ncbi:winged helix-turn-helix domain-containing protein [Deinococcus humi]|uniref:DNA-binding MarR family transcriptional regulator n=1 Tax=Deinococcus humi TaxID=662880 RepID=A0A7W8JV94_9DEIO|nr:transcriptional regulator [Deinococcus humi]MBB5363565.1 DNA-binding MarR family transcriptional regulator [Deinococcus humi]GGO30232.1 transcriptional regulator [Deinococcus humi]
MKHPRQNLAEQLTHPVRFSIVALLAQVELADFGFVRDEVEVSDSVLSRQASMLEEAGLIEIKKDFVGKRPRTRLQLTTQGRTAFRAHVRALEAIVQRTAGEVIGKLSP